MSRSNNSENFGSDDSLHTPPRQQDRRTTIVPRGQDRPRVLVERNRTENRHARTRRDLQFDEGRGSDLEGTSLTISPPDSRSSSRLSYRIPSSTPINPPVSCTVDTERQFLQLQRQIATLTEKIDSLKESANLANHQRANTRREENLPKDMVACVHQIVKKLKEKDPPIEWTLNPANSFNDESNNEVSEAIERGVRATAAFKEANPVLLESAIKTYFKTLKARQKRATTRIRVEGQVIDKQTKSVVSSWRNQRGHIKLKARKEALMQSSYTAEKKRKLQEVLSIDYMSPEESVYEPDNSDEESIPKLEKLLRHKFEWRSDGLDREFQSLDRKADRARSQRAKRMMVPRQEGDIIPEARHSYPKNTPAWALAGVFRKGP
ncbi:uncharacterized protein LOC141860568 [Acropora palmata]|uniref:uncharacterized protein LOC141860565 n=1 Tax=Acropora palmata TaxID=6131 RepID=UPI003DA1AC88